MAGLGVREVLLVTPRWTRDGGVATHVIASAAALAADGVKVSVLCARVDSEERVPGVEVLLSPSLFEQDATPSARMGAALDGEPDVVHLHQVDDPVLVRSLRRRAPVLLSVHGYTACTSGVHYFRPGQECMRAHGVGCWASLTLRNCAHTSNPGRLPRSYRQAAGGLEALRSCDLAIAYSSAIDRHLAINGIEHRATVPLFTTMRPAHGGGHSERRRVLFAGRVVAPKGIAVLIRAARDVDAEFVICGDGWRLEEMRELAARTGVAGRVRFTGWLGSEELAREIAESSLVAMPSIWPEPFGLGGIEAFEAGRPVVASLTGGIGDWLQDAVNGLAVKPGDAAGLARALNELLADPARQQAMGAAGREMAAERFSAERHVQALREAYRRARSSWTAETSAAGSPAGGTPAVGSAP
ncbi:MAG: glycosyltransferase [Solirubrobacterales bacterium]|nr:glycosyltransferase [Solirubrobacterales bacterium]